MGKTVSFYTLGCKVNQADSAGMEALFRQAGYQVVPWEQPAGVVIINTCVVTNTGQRKSRQMINRAVRHNPQALVVVTGCYPQTAPEEVRALSGVDLILGNQDRKRIVELVEQAQGHVQTDTISQVHKLETHTQFESLAGGNEADKTRAYLKIQEGCNQFCTYCIIPYARGPLRSRSLTGIRQEVTRLVKSGYQEIVLIGIHLGCYGRDLSEKTTLYDAVRTALEVKDLPRLRLGSLESVEVEDQLLNLMKDDHRFCPHLHLPLQSGCDKILQKMHRPYDTKRFMQLLVHIRSLVPDIALTTDVIVGFPGETETDFQETCSYVQQCGFAKMHIFPYSRRNGTPAAAMEQQVVPAIKAQRAAVLAGLDEKLHAGYRRSFVGKELRVLWEQMAGPNLVEGLSDNYLRVYAPGTEKDRGHISIVLAERLYGEGIKGKQRIQ